MHIGVDVGGTKIELAVFDQDLAEVSSWREATPIDDYALFIKTGNLESEIRAWLAERKASV